MGSDKASLVHPDGRTLARRAVELLHNAGCDAVVMSLRLDQPIPNGMHESPPYRIIRDEVKNIAGPLAGIATALNSAPDSDWLVIACDMPKLQASDLSLLIQSKPKDQRLFAFRNPHDGKPEPLCAIYGKGTLRLLETAIIMGISSPRDFLISHQCMTIDPPTPDAIINTNTREDWKSIQTD
jgi:molybdopterin-guanine dinucleotide biosynthesis protein A